MKTTKKDFEIFKTECEKWIEIFGLKGWAIEFYHKDDLKDSRASCSYDVVSRSASLYLNITWHEDTVSEANIRKSAFHEVCEVMLCNIRCLAETRFISKIEIDEECHAIIRTLENVLWSENDQ